MEREAKRFLVVVQMPDVNISRLAAAIPQIISVLKSHSRGAPEIAFRSRDGDVCGFFIVTDRPPAFIVAAIQSPGKSYAYGEEMTAPILEGKDALFVIEIGHQFQATPGFTRAGTWLQRN